MTVSTVIPFYNLERYVRPCLDSVVAAFRRMGDGVSLQLVCVDDGSSDSTPSLLDKFAASMSSVSRLSVCVIHQPNGGEGAARNAGVAAATGDWVTFLDGDDVWLPNHLEVAVPLLERHPAADIVALKYSDFDDGAPPPEPTRADEKVFDLGESVPSEVVLEVGVFAGSMARAVWNARKVESQCDYAFGSLEALAASGRRVGREGAEYLASLWLSDVPNRLARLPRAERRGAWEHWRETLGSDCVHSLPRFDRVRRALRRLSFSMSFSLAAARLLRKGGVS